MPMTMTELIDQISRMTKDGECPECHQDANEPNTECETHDEEGAFVMENDDAVNTMNELISLARETCTAETEKSLRDRLREMLVAHIAEQEISASNAISDFCADLRHLADEHNADYGKADDEGYEHYAAERHHVNA
jgi:hypothetical protein